MASRLDTSLIGYTSLGVQRVLALLLSSTKPRSSTAMVAAFMSLGFALLPSKR